MIDQKPSLVHWNYFLALEKDVEILSRYIEFNSDNFNTYSIELAHLLLAASSEIDVVLKTLCKMFDSSKKPNNINGYRKIIPVCIKDFARDKVKIDRFGLVLNPWENWLVDKNPLWWNSYNNVKHERNNYFSEANLKNSLNAMAALLVCIYHYYKKKFSMEHNFDFDDRQTFAHLKPNTVLFHIDRPAYYIFRM